eukprot:2712545-Pleurochrysis_carterae.AAC.2
MSAFADGVHSELPYLQPRKCTAQESAIYEIYAAGWTREAVPTVKNKAQLVAAHDLPPSHAGRLSGRRMQAMRRWALHCVHQPPDQRPLRPVHGQCTVHHPCPRGIAAPGLSSHALGMADVHSIDLSVRRVPFTLGRDSQQELSTTLRSKLLTTRYTFCGA